jgi:hypothetical protein
MPQPTRKTRIRRSTGGHAVHDVGGLAFGPIDREEHDLALWEKRVDAMLILLAGPKKGAFKIDAMRRVIEDYGEQEYDRTTYYEKWIRAIRNLLVEQEIVTVAEVDAAVQAAAAGLRAAGRGIARGRVPWDGLDRTVAPAKASKATKPAKAKPAGRAGPARRTRSR